MISDPESETPQRQTRREESILFWICGSKNFFRRPYISIEPRETKPGDNLYIAAIFRGKYPLKNVKAAAAEMNKICNNIKDIKDITDDVMYDAACSEGIEFNIGNFSSTNSYRLLGEWKPLNNSPKLFTIIFKDDNKYWTEGILLSYINGQWTQIIEVIAGESDVLKGIYLYPERCLQMLEKPSLFDEMRKYGKHVILRRQPRYSKARYTF